MGLKATVKGGGIAKRTSANSDLADCLVLLWLETHIVTLVVGALCFVLILDFLVRHFLLVSGFHLLDRCKSDTSPSLAASYRVYFLLFGKMTCFGCMPCIVCTSCFLGKITYRLGLYSASPASWSSCISVYFLLLHVFAASIHLLYGFWLYTGDSAFLYSGWGWCCPMLACVTVSYASMQSNWKLLLAIGVYQYSVAPRELVPHANVSAS